MPNTNHKPQTGEQMDLPLTSPCGPDKGAANAPSNENPDLEEFLAFREWIQGL